jgi:hypothetical protein
MPDAGYVYPIEDILADINSRTSLRIELHPFWKYPIWENECACFKIREKIVASEQVMDLAVSAKFFIKFGRKVQLTDIATAQVTREIESFFQHRFTAPRPSEPRIIGFKR